MEDNDTKSVSIFFFHLKITATAVVFCLLDFIYVAMETELNIPSCCMV